MLNFPVAAKQNNGGLLCLLLVSHTLYLIYVTWNATPIFMYEVTRHRLYVPYSKVNRTAACKPAGAAVSC
jgi:hypothetical protein